MGINSCGCNDSDLLRPVALKISLQSLIYGKSDGCCLLRSCGIWSWPLRTAHPKLHRPIQSGPVEVGLWAVGLVNKARCLYQTWPKTVDFHFPAGKSDTCYSRQAHNISNLRIYYQHGLLEFTASSPRIIFQPCIIRLRQCPDSTPILATGNSFCVCVAQVARLLVTETYTLTSENDSSNDKPRNILHPTLM